MYCSTLFQSVTSSLMQKYVYKKTACSYLVYSDFYWKFCFSFHKIFRDRANLVFVKLLEKGIPVTCNFRMGSTIAKNLSAERAVNVKTDTPIEMSFAHSDNLHSKSPKGQESKM